MSKRVYVMCSLIPTLVPISVYRLLSIDSIGAFVSTSGLIFSVLLSLIYGINQIKKIIIDRLFWGISLLFGVFIFSMILNDRLDFNYYFKPYLQIVSVLLCYYICLYKNQEKVFFDVYTVAMLFLLLIGIIVDVSNPNGIGQTYRYNIARDYRGFENTFFWGTKNYCGFYLVPFIGMSFLKNTLFHKQRINLSVVSTIVISIIAAIISGSATTLVAVFVFYCALLLENTATRTTIRRAIDKLTGKTVAIIYLFLFCGIFFLADSGIVRFILTNILHRNATLTGRISIWIDAFLRISEKPILGYGFDSIIEHVNYYWYAHNLILDILIQGGIVALAVFVSIYYSSFKKMNYNIGEERSKLGEQNYVIIFLLAIVILQLTESTLRLCPYTFLIFGIGRTINILIKRKREGEYTNRMRGIRFTFGK